MKLAGAAAYGGLRSKVSDMLVPLSSKIPAGEYADEIACGIAAWALGKFVPAARPITDAALVIEASRIGATLAGNMGGSTSTASSVRYG